MATADTAAVIEPTAAEPDAPACLEKKVMGMLDNLPGSGSRESVGM